MLFTLVIAGFIGVTSAVAATPGANGRLAFLPWVGGALITTINADGSGATAVPNTTTPGNVTWSPDGTKIAFASSMFGPSALYTANLDGTNLRRLSPDPVLGDYAPSWSPDGTKIVFGSQRGDSSGDIYVMNATGGGLRRLTATPGEYEDYPTWSPDGRQIAFSGSVGGNYEIFVMNADGSGRTRLTFDAPETYHPSWSPDGSRIAYTSAPFSNADIYVMRADGSDQHRLAANGIWPAWSPDGTKMAFAQFDTHELAVMNADGTGRRKLGPRGIAPAWQTGSGPAVATRPLVTGTPAVGATLTASTGTWWGPKPLSFSYQWQRCVAYPGSDGHDYGSVVVHDGPLGYWRLDEATGTLAADASGHGRSGAYVGGVALGTAGALADDLDKAPLFDGLTGNVDVFGVPNASFASGFTVEAWVKVEAALQWDKGIAGKWNYTGGGGMLLWLNNSGTYAFAVGKARWRYLQTAVAPTPGVWEHLVGTWDGRIIRLYRDGIQIGWRQFAGPVGNPTIPFQIASYGIDKPQFRLRGAVDEVALYGRALTAGDVRAHFAASTVGRCVDLPAATSATHDVGARDVGAQFRVVVSAANGGGRVAARSELTPPVAP